MGGRLRKSLKRGAGGKKVKNRWLKCCDALITLSLSFEFKPLTERVINTKRLLSEPTQPCVQQFSYNKYFYAEK